MRRSRCVLPCVLGCVFAWVLLPSFVSGQTLQGGASITGTAQIGAGANPFITIAIAPATASVVVNATQIFTFTIGNDINNQGAALTLVCSGGPCGTISATNVKNGGTVTYTAPANVPTIPSVTLTATSVQDSTRFTNAIFSIVPNQGPAPSITIVKRNSNPTQQTTAASNTWPMQASQGSNLAIGLAGSAGTVFSGATDNLSQTWTLACQKNQASVGTVAIYYKQGSTPGVTSVTTATSSQAGIITSIIWDLGNSSNNAPISACSGSATTVTSATPTGVAAQAGGAVLGVLASDVITGANSPFTFTQLAAANGAADNLITTNGTYGPTYTQNSFGWAGANISFAAGNTPGVIGLNITPSAPSVVISTTQAFTVNVVNDSAHAGSTLALTCTGSGCGTLSSSTVAEGGSVTYTAPASVPGSAVTLTATSVTDPTKKGTASITVSPIPVLQITVSPVSTSTSAGGTTLVLTPTITNDSGTGNATVAMTGSNCSGSGCGSLSATTIHTGSGVTYTPPPTLSTNLNVQVLFTSVTDPTKSATATISVFPATTGSTQSCNSPCPAFFGAGGNAEGDGALAHGGRGGAIGGSTSDGNPQVFNINSLADSTNAYSCNSSGECTNSTLTLRDCLQASGPRFCIFRVSGLITGMSRLGISNPYIYVAGQTAPKDNIVIGGNNQVGEQIFTSTHDVVVRYITHDGNNPSTITGPKTGTVAFEIASCGANCYNIVYDHLSAYWYGNKDFPLENNSPGQGIHDISYTWNLEYEPNATHPVGGMAFDATTGSSLLNTRMTVAHNVFATIDHRLPFNQAGSQFTYINNFHYNWNQYAFLDYGGTALDIIGNKYVDGNISSDTVHTFLFDVGNDPSDGSDNCSGGNPCDNPGPPSIYMLNNQARPGNTPNSGLITPTNVVNDSGEIGMTRRGWEGGETGDSNSSGPVPGGWFRTTANPIPTYPVTIVSVSNLEATLLPTAGNSQHLDCLGNFVGNRNAIDGRIINVIQNRLSDNLFTDGSQTSPTVNNGTACVESMNDGIPDLWKQKYGFSTSDPLLWKHQDSKTHLLILEDYLDGLPPSL